MKTPKKAVVTGGAGFIGSHIAEELVRKNFEVVVVDDLSTGKLENMVGFKDKIEFVKGSITDTALLRKIFTDADFVFHQAALGSVPKSVEFPLETDMVNVYGTLSVFVAARDAGVKRVVYASSGSVYGDSPILPKVETMQYNPLSPYGAHKMMDEIYAKLFWKLYKLETVGLRYFNVFGPRQDPKSKYSAVIPLFIKMISEGSVPTINGDGKVTRDFTYVKNVVSANILASVAKGAQGQVFNVACGEQVSINDLVSKISALFGKKIKPKYTDMRVGDIEHSLADISKAKKILGYEPKISFNEGLKNLIRG